jgi:DnaJ-class molecular chaperone
MPPENYYDFLALPRDATPDEVRAAYRERARHPPPGQGEEWFRTLRTAYEVLSDPQKRAEYDAALGPPANGQASVEDLQRRLQLLEGELSLVRRQRDEYRRMAGAPVEVGDLSEDWLKEPEGAPIAEVLAEYEARLKAKP